MRRLVEAVDPVFGRTLISYPAHLIPHVEALDDAEFLAAGKAEILALTNPGVPRLALKMAHFRIVTGEEDRAE